MEHDARTRRGQIYRVDKANRHQEAEFKQNYIYMRASEQKKDTFC